MKRGIRLAFAFIGLAAGAGAGVFAYFFHSTTIEVNELTEWQKGIEDERSINSLYIPGTHDALADYAMGDLTGKCQDLKLSSQLNAGSRFLDLRYKVSGDELRSAHGIVDEKTFFKDDTKVIENFLKAHPSEFLFVSVKMESNDDPNRDRFESTLLKSLDTSIWDTSSTLPSKVGQARGKAFLISRSYDPTVGVDANPSIWKDNATFDLGDFHIQDEYKIADTNAKKSAIEKSFVETDKLKLHFFSGYLSPGFPPSSSVKVAQDINPWVKEALGKPNSNGIIILDFLTTDLAKEVVGRNK